MAEKNIPSENVGLIFFSRYSLDMSLCRDCNRILISEIWDSSNVLPISKIYNFCRFFMRNFVEKKNYHNFVLLYVPTYYLYKHEFDWSSQNKYYLVFVYLDQKWKLEFKKTESWQMLFYSFISLVICPTCKCRARTNKTLFFFNLFLALTNVIQDEELGFALYGRINLPFNEWTIR